VCRTLAELVEAVRSTRPEAVLKPLNTYCGIGVTFLPSTAPEPELAAYLERWGPEVTVQPYLPEITATGDVRVLTVGERILGAVRRLPPEGSRLANLHGGGVALPAEPTPDQEAACREVAAELGRQGLHLLGLDFIGPYLTEINFTSPTLLVQIEELSGRPARAILADELERLAGEG
jgi:glutathione synthase